MKTKSNDVNNRDPRIVTMYRVAIGIGFFALFISFTTIYVMNRVEKARYHVLVTIDANGGNIKPNRLGHDVFVFQIKNNKIRAMGRKDSLYPIKRYYFYCDGGSKSKDQLLGVNCAYNALFDQKYFSKL